MPCVFCGVVGKLSAEHVFGDWLNRIGLSDEPVAHSAGWLNRSSRDLGVTRPFQTRVRDVCLSCNGGWMSALEAVAARVLTPFILGEDGTIPPQDHAVIAAWAHKTALVNMLVSSAADRANGYGLPPGEYAALHATQTRPPAGTRFWIGRYEGEQRISAWVTPKVVRIKGAEEPIGPQAYSMTIILGKLVLQGLRFTTPTLDLDVDAGEQFTRLWPSTGQPVSWTARAISVQALNSINKGLNHRSLLAEAELLPWRTATDLPPSTLHGAMVRLPTPCGRHFVFYPALLAEHALKATFHLFSTACECGKSYLVRTEADGARFKAEGTSEEIETMYESATGQELRLDDENGAFFCKRLNEDDCRDPENAR